MQVKILQTSICITKNEQGNTCTIIEDPAYQGLSLYIIEIPYRLFSTMLNPMTSRNNFYYSNNPMALGSCLYNVFQGLILDADLAPYTHSEHDLAYQHLAYSHSDDLTLYDRGYPAFWLFAAHQDKGTRF